MYEIKEMSDDALRQAGYHYAKKEPALRQVTISVADELFTDAYKELFAACGGLQSDLRRSLRKQYRRWLPSRRLEKRFHRKWFDRYSLEQA